MRFYDHNFVVLSNVRKYAFRFLENPRTGAYIVLIGFKANIVALLTTCVINKHSFIG